MPTPMGEHNANKQLSSCLLHNQVDWIKALLDNDHSASDNHSSTACRDDYITITDLTVLNSSADVTGWDIRERPVDILNRGQDVYAYVTPFIIVVGILGNLVSLRILLSERMRKMSASIYLASLAVSDTCVLLTHALLEWLLHGLPRWPGGRAVNLIAVSGLCQAYTFCSYVFRFTSVWFIVAFTIERFVGICFPLQRRTISQRASAVKLLGLIVSAAVLISVYKPFLVGVQSTRFDMAVCSWNLSQRFYSFILDSIYGTLITVIPFILTACFNVCIVWKMREINRCPIRSRIVSKNSIKMEFKGILLVVSTASIVLNFPYFVMWCYNFVGQLQIQIQKVPHSSYELIELHVARGWKYIIRTIFLGNYCVNFFIYSLSGRNFRCQLKKHLFGGCKKTHGVGEPTVQDQSKSIASTHSLQVQHAIEDHHHTRHSTPNELIIEIDVYTVCN